MNAPQVFLFIAQYYELRYRDLICENRDKYLIRPRFIAIYLCRKYLGLNLRETGELFGWRHHTTIIHAERWVKEKMIVDEEFRYQMQIIERKLLEKSHAAISA